MAAETAEHKNGWHSHHVHGRYAISDQDDKPGQLKLRFMCPDREPAEIRVQEIILPGTAGVFSILSEHTPMLSALSSGVIEVFNNEEQNDHFAIGGGFAVVENDVITIMCEAWEHAKEIDIERATAAQNRAEEIIKKAVDSVEVLQAEAALARALARIQTHSGQSY